MAHKIFIDGAAGTTGLEIRQRLSSRSDLTLLELADSERKEAAARARVLNEADLVILCLPDDAAREAVSLIENPEVRVVDASTAHRTAPGWTYGFAELEKDSSEKIAASKRVSNPGCWATAFIALVRPLVRADLLPAEYPVAANGVSGYSGGGKSMIAEFENKDGPTYTETVVRGYAYTLAHKHLPEMTMHTGLSHPPVLAPSVGRFYRGMMVEVPLALWSLPGNPAPRDIRAVLEEAYAGAKLVDVASEGPVPVTLDAEALKGTNALRLHVFGNDKSGQVRLVALLDNLGKGAGGAAVQNLNIMLGLPETEGLV
ncbi:N-acetyl-gamma-glutamyl-phosphate reductase [Rhizomicrobium palustre]|uniref:N-acetyl-gamma-glutamyl-phosphate reductase n=1 Tax=Rhizomicrobium palustre TaxID=189966 RepID=A0A846N4C4_9PROT|nr:N-acetyl-gamma-glutamyl-phosphate reductase [Rhizomicrobium palustre]